MAAARTVPWFRRDSSRAVPYTILVLLAVFAVGPILVLVFNSLKTDAQIGVNPLGVPNPPVLQNYADAWQLGGIGVGLRNSLIIAGGSVLGVWVIAGMAAYAMARLRVAGSSVVMFYLLVGTALPAQLFVVPLYFLWSRIGLYDNLLGLIIIHWGTLSPFATLLLRSYLLALPRDFEEAARIDGASEASVLARVVLPLAWPGFVTAGLVTGLASWNEFFFAITMMETNSKMPVVTVFLNFVQGFQREWGLSSAAGVMIIVPVIALFLLLQRRFVAGLTSSGLHG